MGDPVLASVERIARGLRTARRRRSDRRAPLRHAAPRKPARPGRRGPQRGQSDRRHHRQQVPARNGPARAARGARHRDRAPLQQRPGGHRGAARLAGARLAAVVRDRAVRARGALAHRSGRRHTPGVRPGWRATATLPPRRPCARPGAGACDRHRQARGRLSLDLARGARTRLRQARQAGADPHAYRRIPQPHARTGWRPRQGHRPAGAQPEFRVRPTQQPRVPRRGRDHDAARPLQLRAPERARTSRAEQPACRQAPRRHRPALPLRRRARRIRAGLAAPSDRNLPHGRAICPQRGRSRHAAALDLRLRPRRARDHERARPAAHARGFRPAPAGHRHRAGRSRIRRRGPHRAHQQPRPAHPLPPHPHPWRTSPRGGDRSWLHALRRDQRALQPRRARPAYPRHAARSCRPAAPGHRPGARSPRPRAAQHDPGLRRRQATARAAAGALRVRGRFAQPRARRTPQRGPGARAPAAARLQRGWPGHADGGARVQSARCRGRTGRRPRAGDADRAQQQLHLHADQRPLAAHRRRRTTAEWSCRFALRLRRHASRMGCARKPPHCAHPARGAAQHTRARPRDRRSGGRAQ